MTTFAGTTTYFPKAKVGNGYVYAYNVQGMNYFGISKVDTLRSCSNGGCIDWDGQINTTMSITVNQAAAIDAKMDDGMPGTGKVMAFSSAYGNNIGWGGVGYGTAESTIFPIQAVSSSSTSCYDTSLGTGTSQKYSLAQNGNSINCVLSFQWQ